MLTSFRKINSTDNKSKKTKHKKEKKEEKRFLHTNFFPHHV